jgi:hypothetical protein
LAGFDAVEDRLHPLVEECIGVAAGQHGRLLDDLRRALGLLEGDSHQPFALDVAARELPQDPAALRRLWGPNVEPST